jgi:hypothetical protein
MCYNMKTILFNIFCLIILTACNYNKSQTLKSIDRNLKVPNLKKEKSKTKLDCDSLKFKDFKTNINLIEIKIKSEFENEINKIADNFIKNQCEKDTLFCDEIYLKSHNHYRSSLGYDLFTFGYAFKNSENEIENKSANFYVFGIKKNGKTIFYDIVDDLMGEIQFDLFGFENLNGKYIIWGEMFQYFSTDENGKFKLTIDGKNKYYEFQCKSIEN